MSNFRLPCLRYSLVRRQRTRGNTYACWMLCGGCLVILVILRHLPSTANLLLSACFFDGSAVIRPVGAGSRPGDHGRGQGRVSSLSLSWQTRWSHHPIVMPTGDSSDPWLDHTSNFWPLKEHHCAEGFDVSVFFKMDYPPLWRGLFSPSTHTDAFRETRGL